MPVDFTKTNLSALATWQGELACPVCLGELRAQEDVLRCTGCGRAYPVLDGIPVLIAERAVEAPRRAH